MVLDPQALAVLREKDGYTKTAFAGAAGISLGYLCDLETGRRNAKPDVIKRMAGVLNVPTSMLERKRSA